MRIITGSLFVLLIVLVLSITGCTPIETGPGTINVLVTSTIVGGNAPVSSSEAEIEISSIKATVSEIKVYRGGAIQETGNEQGQWVNLYVASKSIALLKNSGQEQFLAFMNVAATSYDEIVMVIDRLDVTLSNGVKVIVTPDEPFAFDASFVVYAGKTTDVIFIFNIDKSVTFTNENQVTIKPLAGITLNVRYEKID